MVIKTEKVKSCNSRKTRFVLNFFKAALSDREQWENGSKFPIWDK